MMSKGSSNSLGIKSLEVVSSCGFLCFEEDEVVTARPVFRAIFSSTSSKRCVRVKSAFSKLVSGRREILRRSEEHTSELQSHSDLVCRLLLEKKKHTSELQVTQ